MDKEYIGVIGTLAGTVIGAFMQPFISRIFNRKPLKIIAIELKPIIKNDIDEENQVVSFNSVIVEISLLNPNDEPKYTGKYSLLFNSDIHQVRAFSLEKIRGDINLPPKSVTKLKLYFTIEPFVFKFKYRIDIGDFSFWDSSTKKITTKKLIYLNINGKIRHYIDQYIMPKTPETDQ